MPRMTAQQLFWTGVGGLLLGVVCTFGYQAMIYDYNTFGLGWFYRFFVVGSGVLVALGSALAAGGLVVGALQRGPAPQRPQPPYPPQGYGPQQPPYPGQGYAPQPPYSAPQPYAAPQQPYAAPQPYAVQGHPQPQDPADPPR